MIRVVKCHFEVIFCFLTNRNCHIFQVDKAIIQVAEWHVKVIFFLLQAQYLTLVRSGKQCFKWSPGNQNSFSFTWPAQKWNGWRQKKLFQVVAFHFELTFGLLTIPKCDLDEFVKVIFHGLQWHSQLAKNANWWKRKKRCFRWSTGNQNSFSSSWAAQNATWVKSKKRRYKRLHVILNSYSASWPSQNATWMRSEKRRFKVSHGTLNLFWTCGLAKNAIWMKWKKPCFNVSNGIHNLFWASGLGQNAIWIKSKSDDSSWRMSLWSYFLLLDQPKMWLFLSRLKWTSALKSPFLPLEEPEIRLWWGRESDISSVRQALGTHFLPLTNPKCEIGEVEKAMFQGVAWHF